MANYKEKFKKHFSALYKLNNTKYMIEKDFLSAFQTCKKFNMAAIRIYKMTYVIVFYVKKCLLTFFQNFRKTEFNLETGNKFHMKFSKTFPLKPTL